MSSLALLLFICLGLAAEGQEHVYKTFSIPNFGKIDATFAFKQKQGLTVADKQHVLDMHNALRARLAKGAERNSWNGKGSGKQIKMPPASNMQAMEWDDQLASYAQKWANKCKTGHSPLDKKEMPRYKDSAMGENLSGDTTFLEKDMYGEVRWWNFDKFACKKGEQCGHYLNFAAFGMSRVGCGWRICDADKAVSRVVLVCIYSGVQNTAKEAGKKRQPMQHEYFVGPPCSLCQQGWDFCMGGSLCATKAQCDSDPTNKCTPLNNKGDCEGNGGTFDASDSSCKCPKDKWGINCARPCANLNDEPCGMKCGSDPLERYFCHKSCKGCGVAQSPHYDYWFKTHKNENKDGIKVRHTFEDPDATAAKIDLKTFPDYGKCKNKAPDRKCKILQYRGYCKDQIYGSTMSYHCSLSCSTCDAQKAKRDKENAEAAKSGYGDIGDIEKALAVDLSKKKSLSNAELTSLGSLDGADGLDLSLFKKVSESAETSAK